MANVLDAYVYKSDSDILNVQTHFFKNRSVAGKFNLNISWVLNVPLMSLTDQLYDRAILK